MSNYLQEFIIPNFLFSIDQKIISAIKDINGGILCATNLYATSSGYDNWEGLVGISYANATQKNLQHLLGVDNKEMILQLKPTCDYIAKIEKAVVVEKKVISYIEMIPFQNIYESFLVTIVPLFDSKSQIVAFQVYYSSCGLFGVEDYFKQLKKSTKVCKKFSEDKDIRDNNSVELTKKELEICYLLANGFSQYEISEILQVSRGTVAKTISDRICPKFNITGSNSKLLMEKIEGLEYLKSPPKSLLKPLVLVLDEEIRNKLYDS